MKPSMHEMRLRLAAIENAIKQETLEAFRAALSDVDIRDMTIVRRAIERQWTGRKARIFGDAISEEIVRMRKKSS